MKQFLMISVLLMLVSGCAGIKTPLDEGYEFGDTTDSMLSVRAEYCATADPGRRALLLGVLRAAGAPVPPSGACGDIVERAISRGLLPDLEVDVEQAERDRERFEGEAGGD